MNVASLVTAVLFAYVMFNPSVLAAFRKHVYATSLVNAEGYVENSLIIIPVAIVATLGYMVGPYLAKMLAPVTRRLAPAGDFLKRMGAKILNGGKKLMSSAPKASKAVKYTPGVDASAVDPAITAAEEKKASVTVKQAISVPLKSAPSGSHSQGTDLAASSVGSAPSDSKDDTKSGTESAAPASEKSGGLSLIAPSGDDASALAVVGADSQISLQRRINALSSAQQGRQESLTRARGISSRVSVSKRSTGAHASATARQQA